MKGRYPLDALQQLRRGAVDGQLRRVAEQQAEAARARDELARAQAQREQAEGVARELTDAERARLEAGEARVVDLQTEVAWQTAEQQRQEALRAAERSAKDRSDARQLAEVTERERLARVEAEAKAIEQHRDRWRAERERQREAAEEDEAQDVVLSRRTRRESVK